MIKTSSFLKNTILIFVLLLTFKSQTQNKKSSETKLLDSFIAKKEYIKADSLLLENIEQLKQNKNFLELTKRIYYLGKIKVNLEGKELAVKKVNDFANTITQATDSATVSRQKHLVLARFYVFLRDYENASQQNLSALEETKKIPNATGDLYGLIHHNLSIDYRRLGDLKKATWHSKKAISYYLSYPKSDKNKILDAYNSLGGRMWDAYKIDSALFYFKKGEKIIEELDQTPINKFYHKAKAQANISSVYALLGQFNNAQNYNEKAIKNYTNFIKSGADGKDFFKEEARLFLFMTIENYADDFSKQGNYKKTKDLLDYVYEQKLMFLPDNDTEIAFTSLQLGNINLKLKNYQIAEDFFNKGLDIYTKQEPKNYLGIADAYYYKGVINEFNNNTDKAKVFYEKSKGYYENIFGNNYDVFYLNAMSTYSRFYSKNGYSDKAIKLATKAYNYVIENQGKETVLEYSQLLNLANINYEAKNYNKALLQVDQTLNLLKYPDSLNVNQINVLNIRLKPLAILLKSKIEFQVKPQKDSIFLKEQFLNLKEAIRTLEQQKSIFNEDKNLSVFIDNNNTIFEFSKKIALMLYHETKNPEYLKEALSFHESKLYNKIRQQLNIQSSFSLKDIPEEILKKENQLKKAFNKALDFENGLDTFIKTNTKWNNFLESLKNDYPKYYALRYASISKSLDGVGANFPEKTSIVRYVYIDKNLYAFIIENSHIEVFKLDTPSINNILKNTEKKHLENDLTRNYSLYKLLWQPFADRISNTNIIIIPDDELFNLSFETLTPTKAESFKMLSKNSLLSKHTISYNYSLLLINKNKMPKFFDKNFVAFIPEFNDQMKTNYKTTIEDSVFLDKTYLKLLPQPFSVDLAKEYSRLFNGNYFINENASKQIFTNEANEHKIIHIGTHAESNNVTPELSRLIFAKNSEDEDNSLYTYEIYNQNLNSNLAILTACETGKPTYQAGEGMISLAHAFNYAGSESILTSLWKIDEQSSTKIIELFYDNIKKGLPKDKALQLAKLDYIASSEGRIVAPHYWAGLVLIGDTSPIDLNTNSTLSWYILGFLLLIIAVFYIIKTRKK